MKVAAVARRPCSIREGTPLPEVKAQLGHSSLSVTSRYLDHVLPEDLAESAKMTFLGGIFAAPQLSGKRFTSGSPVILS